MCDKVHQTIIASKRKLTQEQVFLIFANEEFQIVQRNYFVKKYKVASNTIYTIIRHKAYQDYWYDYQLLTDDQKKVLVSLLRN